MRWPLVVVLGIGLSACGSSVRSGSATNPRPTRHILRRTATVTGSLPRGSSAGSPIPNAAAGHARRTATSAAKTQVVGHSTRGRPIRLITLTGAPGGRSVLAVGCIHGTECAGQAVTRRLVQRGPSGTGTVWVVPDINPDGHALGTRVNARGVDLNRNFPTHWQRIGAPGTPQYSGRRPLSERESRLATRLIERLRPAVTIWFHQPEDVVRAWGQSVPLARHYAHLAGARFRAIPWPAGAATNWQNHTFPGTTAFVVELAAGPLQPTQAARYAHAIGQLVAGR